MDAGEWLVSASESIFLNLYRPTADDGQDEDVFDNDFNPVFTHQMFEDEAIFGYKGLEIKLGFRAHDMRPTFDSQFDDQWKDLTMVKAVDYKATISDFVPPAAFKRPTKTRAPEHADWTPPGDKIKSYSTDDGDEFEIWRASLADARTRTLFSNFRILIPFFIEGGTCMDLDDAETMADRWTVYFLYRLFPAAETTGGQSRYCFAGFSTTFRWWVFPSSSHVRRVNSVAKRTVIKPRAEPSSRKNSSDSVFVSASPVKYLTPTDTDADVDGRTDSCSRVCLSQFVLLPPFQRQGHGSRLYRAIYADIMADPYVFELTVEDPSEDFDYLRDFCDFTQLLSMPDFTNLSFPAHLDASALAPTAPVPTKALLSAKQVEGLRNESKMTARQFDRMVEIFLFSKFPTSQRIEYNVAGQQATAAAFKKLVRSKPGKIGDLTESQKWDTRYLFWTLLVKNRIFIKNEDVLRQLDEDERVERVTEAMIGVQDEYSTWIEELITKSILKDDSVNPPSRGIKRKAGGDGEDDESDDDNDSVLGKPDTKRVSVEPGRK